MDDDRSPAAAAPDTRSRAALDTRSRAALDTRSRAMGALVGLALGDALGMPTESMSREHIARVFGAVDGLRDAPDDQPIAPGMPAGSITDDTEQALLVGELVVRGGGHVDPHEFARALAQWEHEMAAKGSLSLLGPSTKAAVAAIEQGVPPERTGLHGTTNGAAMRVAPVGIACGPEGDALLRLVVEASLVTHNTNLGLSAAAAVAMATSSGIEGATREESLARAVAVAEQAAPLGAWCAGGSIAARIRWAVDALTSLDDEAAADFLVEVVGTSVASQESVVAAFALAVRFWDDPWRALCLAASIGGDTDTMGAIAGAVLGAHHGVDVWPTEAVAQVVRVNSLELEPLVDALLELREGTR